MTLNRISAKMTYVMWCSEHLSDAGVLQSLYLSNLIFRNFPYSRVTEYTPFLQRP
jgi:hypothetical protein